MKLNEYLSVIEKFLVDYLDSTHAKGYVVGLSGGVDSSLVSVLAKKAVGKEKITGIMMPIDSLKEDLLDALELAKDNDINYLVIDGSEIFHQYLSAYQSLGIELDTATKSNLKARIRMSILYAYAQKNGLLVLGTDNKDERYTGYFTKHGDGAADLFPIAKLLKREVVEASKLLGISTRLAERVPSAGLFPGQTDEKEMGVTYQDLDDFLIGKPINEQAKQRIEYLHKISEHKRCLTPEPEDFIRE